MKDFFISFSADSNGPFQNSPITGNVFSFRMTESIAEGWKSTKLWTWGLFPNGTMEDLGSGLRGSLFTLLFQKQSRSPPPGKTAEVFSYNSPMEDTGSRFCSSSITSNPRDQHAWKDSPHKNPFWVGNAETLRLGSQNFQKETMFISRSWVLLREKKP
jgi:hypothetical protein